MKKLGVSLAAITVAVVASSVLVFAFQATGSANLHQVNQSGIKARISFLDSGSPNNQLVISGTATGMEPNQAYISLVYDTGSVPGGPLACEPSSSSTLTGAQMFVGVWQVDANGNGTLSSTKTGAAYVSLSEIGNISVRLAMGGVLQACGKVHP